MPKVSVCIPTHNTARYLPEAIESVLRQEFVDYELVICDNASTDGTPELCQGYADPRVRYMRFEDKTNQAGNFNRCLREARGELLTILHADDYFLPGFLADRVGRLASRPDVGFAFGSVWVVDAASAMRTVNRRWSEDRTFSPGELLNNLLFGCLVSPPSLMVRKSAAYRNGPFRTDLTWGHDWEWALRLAERNSCFYASHPLAAYRIHDASGTAEVLNAAQNGFQERIILRETLARLTEADPRFKALRRPVFRALGLRHMYFAEQALLGRRRGATRNNLWYAALADAGMLARPTFWALLSGSLGSVRLYELYRLLRGPESAPQPTYQ